MIDSRLAFILITFALASCIQPVSVGTDHRAAYELENAQVQDAFIIAADTDASEGAYLTQPATVENRAEPVESATIDMSVPTSDTYHLWVRMHGPTGNEDAAYLGMNAQLIRIYPTQPGRYEWVRAGSWELSEGDHTMSIGYAESGARLDLAIITNEELNEAELNGFITTSTSSEPVCGNSILEEGEECDEGENNGPCTQPGCAYCASDCTIRTTPEPTPDRAFTLRVDPNFSIEDLTPEARIWHERLIRGFASQDPSYSTNPAGSDNLYNLGRQVHTHIQSLLWALRASGDARILDEVDTLAERMRATLSDSWCAPEPDHHYGYIGEDGYDNWRWRGDHSVHTCRDTHKLDESKTHGLIATIAYAYEANRNVESPAGIDYGERADFWKDYLFNHYEKKWQSRLGREDALTRVEGYGSGHAQMSNAKMHYYLYRLSEDPKYLERSISLSAPVIEGFRISPTDHGDAYVWAQRWRTSPEPGFYLQATTYARYVLADFAELHVEGVEPWDGIDMSRFSRTLTEYIMDDGSNSFARDIGGGIERAGIPPVPEDERDRFNANRYAISPYVMVLPWDDTGYGALITEEVYEKVEGSGVENPRRLYIPAGMVFYHEWRS